VGDIVIHMNLGTKKLLKTVLVLQVVVLGLIEADFIEINIPILRQVICFIYLSFIPGILILRIFKLYELSIIETILYSVGLSLSFLIFTGLLMNTLYPLIGISKPLSEMLLIITINIIVLFLCSVCYLRDKDYSTTFSINIQQVFSLPILSLLLFPFLAIFGTYLLNFYDNNLILLILLTTISMVPILATFDRISSDNFPLAIWSISLSLLLYISLFGTYMRPTDNLWEISLANQVIKNGIWDSTIPSSMNAMLSIVFNLPIYSLVSGLSIIQIFKIMIPLIFSFVPVGLYQAFRTQTTPKIAFLSCFFFISQYEFFTWAGITMKQVSAGLFLTLILLLITDKNIIHIWKTVLLMIFSFSLAVSHYGGSYIFMFCLIITTCILFLYGKIKDSTRSNSIITPTFAILYSVFAVAWYIYISKSSSFITMINLGNHIIFSILNTYFIPRGSYLSQILFGEWPLSLQILKLFFIITSIFMIVGVINLIYKPKFKFNEEYAVFAITFLAVGGSVFLGFLSGTGTPDRIYHYISFFLAPFCIIGGIVTIEYLAKTFKSFKPYSIRRNTPKFLSVFLAIFLLLNTGFVSEVIFKDHPGASIYISKSRIEKSGNVWEKEYFDYVHLSSYDVYGAYWLGINKVDAKIYCGLNAVQNLRIVDVSINLDINNILLLINETELDSSYIYLTEFNHVIGRIKIKIGTFPKLLNIDNISQMLDTNNKIYINGGSVIYYR